MFNILKLNAEKKLFNENKMTKVQGGVHDNIWLSMCAWLYVD